MWVDGSRAAQWHLAAAAWLIWKDIGGRAFSCLESQLQHPLLVPVLLSTSHPILGTHMVGQWVRKPPILQGRNLEGRCSCNARNPGALAGEVGWRKEKDALLFPSDVCPPTAHCWDHLSHGDTCSSSKQAGVGIKK